MCRAAAHTGVLTARTLTAPPGAGATAARNYLTATADNSVSHTRIIETSTPTTVGITCRGDALTLLPLPGLTVVTGTATAGRERFTTAGAP